MFLNLLTKWKESENVLKYILIVFIIIIAILEGFRLFIHNLTTRTGWWMFIIGAVMATAALFVLSYNGIINTDQINDFVNNGLLDKWEVFKSLFS